MEKNRIRMLAFALGKKVTPKEKVKKENGKKDTIKIK